MGEHLALQPKTACQTARAKTSCFVNAFGVNPAVPIAFLADKYPISAMQQEEAEPRQNFVVYLFMGALAVTGLLWSLWRHFGKA